MLQYTAHPSPSTFSDGSRNPPSAASTPRFLMDAPSNLGPQRLAVPLTHKGSIDTDLSQDRFSSFPQVVPRTPCSFSHHPNDFPHPPSSPKNHSSLSSHIEDVLSQGDIVGEGIPLLGEPLRLVSNRFAEHVPAADHQEPATKFEVVRKLGTGSYSVVYHVREVLCHSPPSEDDHFYLGGRLEFDDVSVSRSPSAEYGREYAIKLLSKAHLDEEELVALLTEVRAAPYLSSLQDLRQSV